MSFTYDLTATGNDLIVSKIRLEIGDDNSSADQGARPDGTNFSDAELLYFYEQESSNLLAAAAHACEVLGRMHARASKNVRLRGYSINSTDKAKEFRELAAELRHQSGTKFAGGSAPITRIDGHSNDVNSRENTAADNNEYYGEKKEIRWWP